MQPNVRTYRFLVTLFHSARRALAATPATGPGRRQLSRHSSSPLRLTPVEAGSYRGSRSPSYPTVHGGPAAPGTARAAFPFRE